MLFFFLPFALHTHASVSMVQFCVSIVFVHWGPTYNNIIGPFCSLFLLIKDLIYVSIYVSCFILFYGCCGGGVGVVLLVVDSLLLLYNLFCCHCCCRRRCW